jgi:hypothetical protein
MNEGGSVPLRLWRRMRAASLPAEGFAIEDEIVVDDHTPELVALSFRALPPVAELPSQPAWADDRHGESSTSPDVGAGEDPAAELFARPAEGAPVVPGPSRVSASAVAALAAAAIAVAFAVFGRPVSVVTDTGTSPRAGEAPAGSPEPARRSRASRARRSSRRARRPRPNGRRRADRSAPRPAVSRRPRRVAPSLTPQSRPGQPFTPTASPPRTPASAPARPGTAVAPSAAQVEFGFETGDTGR